MFDDPNFSVRYIFENDSSSSQVFQLDYLSQIVMVTVDASVRGMKSGLLGLGALALISF